MTTASRTIGGIGRVGAITLGFLFTPICVTMTTRISEHFMIKSLWLTLLGGPLVFGLVTFGAMAIIDRLISS